MGARLEAAAADRDGEAANKAEQDAGKRVCDQAAASGCPVQKAEGEKSGDADDQPDTKCRSAVRGIEIDDANDNGGKDKTQEEGEYRSGIDPGRQGLAGPVESPLDSVGDTVAGRDGTQWRQAVAQ